MAFQLNPSGLLAKIFGRKTISTRAAIDLGIEYDTSVRDYYEQKVRLAWDRITCYKDYEDMDQHDIIASVLDAVAEDSTQVDLATGSLIWVQSENKDVEDVCRKVMDRLEAEEITPAIIREMAKYGDCFERLIYEPGKGVLAIEHVDPKRIVRYEKHGVLLGFLEGANIPDMPEPPPGAKISTPWDYVHFMRLAGRRMLVTYGDSWIRPARLIFRKVVMMEDQLVIYRLRRHPDRDVYYLDVGVGTPVDVAMDLVRMWRQAIKKKQVRTQRGYRYEQYPVGIEEDIFWPTYPGSNSKIERLQGSSSSDNVYDVMLMIRKLFAALRCPPGYFGFEREGGGWETGKALAQQDIRWARGCRSVQKGCTKGWVRLLKIHLPLIGIDPTLPKNKFSVHMTPVSILDEQMKADLYEARIRAMDALNRIVGDLEGLNRKAWYSWLLSNLAGFSSDFLKQFVEEAKEEGMGVEGLVGKKLDEVDGKKIVEFLKPTGILSGIEDFTASSFSDRVGGPLPGG